MDKVRDQRSNLLKIQEKLETVIPVVESGYVNSLLFQKEMAAAGYYQQLLDIEYGQGYVMVVQFGQSYENGRLVSPVGMNVKAQSFYPEFRDVVKSAFPCVVGNIMSNRIPVVVPCEIFQNPYEDRIDLVEKEESWWQDWRADWMQNSVWELEEYGKWKSLRDLTAKHSGH